MRVWAEPLLTGKAAHREELGMRRQPWYWNQTLWLWLAAICLPFGWTLPLCRLAWAHAAVGRAPRPLRLR